MLQCFHWYTPGGGSLWKKLAESSEALSAAGFTALWLPPAYKGNGGGHDTGYGVYDLYDLGEFDQKGSVATKYGTKDEYLAAIEAAHRNSLAIYADIVLNHRMGADEQEQVLATPYERNNRREAKGPQQEISVYTRFTFPGRNERYSDFKWMWHHFDAVDHAADHPDDHDTIYVFEGKQFDDYVSDEFGNYDYLMGCDLDFGAEEVRQELGDWGRWYLDTTGIDGFRIDAVKHIPSWFFPQWLSDMRAHAERDLFAVAEFWDPSLETLLAYVEQTEGTLSLFDVPLHFKFHQAGIEKQDFPLAEIFTDTLVERAPEHAVTFVANHDSQALQALESVIEPWFKPLAYALILLRREGYPCVFIADYEGAHYTDTGNDGNEYTIDMPSFKKLIETMLSLRTRGLGGVQHDYFDHQNTIGWTFEGDDEASALAVLMSNGDSGSKRMATGRANRVFTDATGNVEGQIETDSEGVGEFRCNGASVSIWVIAT
jgi:alpha-amylase